MIDLKSATREAGGVTAVAKSIGVSPQVVSNWIARGQVPAEHAIKFESLTGLSRHDLRPDIFGPAPEQKAAA